MSLTPHALEYLLKATGGGAAAGAGLGAVTGIARPEDPRQKLHSASRDIVRGGAMGAGAGGGGALGVGAGEALAHAIRPSVSGGHYSAWDDVLPVVGGLAGAAGGAYLGHRAGRSMLGPSIDPRNRDDEENDEVRKAAAVLGSVCGSDFAARCVETALAPVKRAGVSDSVNNLKSRFPRKERSVTKAPKFRLNDFSEEGRKTAMLMAIDDQCSRLPLAQQAALRTVQTKIASGVSPIAAFQSVIPTSDKVGEKEAAEQAAEILVARCYKAAGDRLRKGLVPDNLVNEIKKAAAVFVPAKKPTAKAA